MARPSYLGQIARRGGDLPRLSPPRGWRSPGDAGSPEDRPALPAPGSACAAPEKTEGPGPARAAPDVSPAPVQAVEPAVAEPLSTLRHAPVSGRSSRTGPAHASPAPREAPAGDALSPVTGFAAPASAGPPSHAGKAKGPAARETRPEARSPRGSAEGRPPSLARLPAAPAGSEGHADSRGGTGFVEPRPTRERAADRPESEALQRPSRGPQAPPEPEARVAPGPVTLRPPPAPHTAVSSPAQRPREAAIRIGTLEVRIEPPAPIPPAAPTPAATAPRAPTTALSRGFSSLFGLRQG